MKTAIKFLNLIRENNQREWYHENKKLYQEGKKEFEEFIDKVIEGISVFEPGFDELKAKDCTFRIFRDIRFSKNKLPYKTNFGAYMATGGRKSPFAGYYIHLEPGSSFMGGGLWHPEPQILKKVREEIDYCGDEFREILEQVNPSWGSLEGEKLIRPPKGYTASHPDIEYLKHKDFMLSSKIADQEFQNDPSLFSQRLHEVQPLNKFLNRAVEEAILNQKQ